MAKPDLKKLSDAKLNAVIEHLNEQRDEIVREIRALTGEQARRAALIRVKAELERIPKEQRKAILASAAGE